MILANGDLAASSVEYKCGCVAFMIPWTLE